MSTDTFKASVQYNDLTGTAAADRADMEDAHHWLQSQGLIKDGEFLVGVEIYFADAMAAEGEEVHLSASFILVQADTFEAAAKGMQQNEVIPARKVSHEFAPSEFLSLFKRFNVTLSSGGELEGREYSFE